MPSSLPRNAKQPSRSWTVPVGRRPPQRSVRSPGWSIDRYHPDLVHVSSTLYPSPCASFAQGLGGGPPALRGGQCGLVALHMLTSHSFCGIIAGIDRFVYIIHEFLYDHTIFSAIVLISCAALPQNMAIFVSPACAHRAPAPTSAVRRGRPFFCRICTRQVRSNRPHLSSITSTARRDPASFARTVPLAAPSSPGGWARCARPPDSPHRCALRRPIG